MKKEIKYTVFLLFICIGCNKGKPGVEDEKAYLKWLNDPQNNFIKSESNGDLSITLKRIPNEWAAHIEAKKVSNYKAAKDSLVVTFERDITFLLTISPKDESQNVMFREISSLTDFKKRVNDLNFNFGQYLKLQVGDREIMPALVSFENTYEISGQRSMLIRFVDESENKIFVNGQNLVLVWIDEVFWTGVHRFKF